MRDLRNSRAELPCPPAIILAGGFGTRLRVVHPSIPKPMVPVLGRPFLHHLVDHLSSLGIREIIISTGYKGGQIEEYFARVKTCAGISCIREPAALGTGGAIAFALSRIADGDRFFVANGDSIAAFDSTAMLKQMTSEVDAVIAAVRVPDGSRYGNLEISAEGYLKRFSEKSDGHSSSLINAGIYLLRRALFPPGDENRASSLETEWLPGWIAEKKRIAVLESAGPFLDIGTPESLNAAASFLRQRSFLPARDLS